MKMIPASVVVVFFVAVLHSGTAPALGAGEATPQAAPSPAMNPLPGTSLYRLPILLTTAGGASLQLSELRGEPLIVTMFYSQCTSVCPLLTAQVQRIVERLSPAERLQIRTLMVSFDSARDNPQSLADFAARHHLEGDRWIIAKASPGDVRLFAAALGIQYRELADHTFNHSAILAVADRDGSVRARTSELDDTDGSFIAAVRRQIGSAHRRANP